MSTSIRGNPLFEIGIVEIHPTAGGSFSVTKYQSGISIHAHCPQMIQLPSQGPGHAATTA